jgi:hypothetical protein
MLSLAFVNGNLRGITPTALTVSLTRSGVSPWHMFLEVRTSNLPNSYKFNIDVNGKRFFKACALTPSKVIVLGVHLVCKRDLLMIASRQQTNFVDPT